jgi:ribonuclease-3
MSRRQSAREALAARLGHVFADPALLERALTHVSAVANGDRNESYQRLEFLGDRVLGLAVSAMLVEAFPDAAEGELSRRLAELVRGDACAEVATEMGIGPAIRLGPSESQSGGRTRKVILGDICEAVIGALFLDGGFEVARGVVERYWRERMLAKTRLRDAKTELQEWAQGRGLPTPSYIEVARAGPDHKPVFHVQVFVEGLEASHGEGASKRAAEQAAATAFLMREGVWTEMADV